ncbi:MAG: CoB--CoM heterodisulfide reductase iron-sulfur subunit B family protein, partial [Candidatus Hadarchaeales archaeon]
MRKFALFPGCIIPQRLPSIEIAARKVFQALGMEAAEMKGYNCCPDPVIARYMNRNFVLSLSARNLSLAEENGLDVVVLCNGCFESLWEANESLREEKTREDVNTILKEAGRRYEGRSRVKHVVEVLYEDGMIDEVRRLVKYPLRDLKLAIHYGCHLFREEKGKDIWRKPRQLQELVKATGAEVIPCPLDKLCCGFPVSEVDREYSLKRNLLPKLQCYSHLGVDGVVVVCPTCNIQMESGQLSLRRYGANFSIPCLHLVELLALAFGVPAAELHLEFHR